MTKAVVIGAGMGGLSAAIRLRAQGAEVDVYEANSYAGGKLTALAQDGYRFDAGPSLFTLPHLVDELYEVAGKNPRDYFRYQRLPVTCHYFYDDGTQLVAHADAQRWADEIATKLQVPAGAVLRYLQQRQHIYNTASSIFLENSLHRWQTWWSKKVAKALWHLPRLGIFHTMHRENERALQHPKLVQLFNRYATYNGSDPYQAPAILTSIPHLEMNLGAYLPEGGMHSITTGLHQLALDIGVRFHMQQQVERIDIANGKASGIRVGGSRVPADVVVSNMDVFHTYRKLLAEQPAPEKTLQQERSSSALIFYWGIRHTFAELDLHNIFFSQDYAAEFAAIFREKRLYHDPTVYVNITSKYCTADAPAGCENWFVMINVPANQQHPWQAWVPLARQHVLDKLGRILGRDIAPLIATEAVLDPPTIEARTGSYQGSLYGTSSNSRYAAFLRHPNFSSRIKGLYFAGGSAHPGGGIPLAILSGKIAASLALGR
jgi:phytoene desaturase